MKALTLWQPWATAIAIGAKRFETRSWRTSYRGPILIHAAARAVDELEARELWNLAGLSWPPGYFFPRGAIVAAAQLVEVHPTESLLHRQPPLVGPAERVLGDFTVGRQAWELRDVRRLREPVPCRGGQGIWEVPGDVAALASAATPA